MPLFFADGEKFFGFWLKARFVFCRKFEKTIYPKFPNNCPSRENKEKIFFEKKHFFQIVFFFQKIFENFFLRIIKKMFFVSKHILCCPQKVTKFCSKKKGEIFLRKNFFCFYKKIFRKVFEKKNCSVFHEIVVSNNWPPPSWKQGIFFHERGGQLLGNYG